MDSYPRYLPQVGVRSAAMAEFPDQFIGQQIFPLSVRKTRQVRAAEHKLINLERDFFCAESLIFGSVTLKGFKITDWFPRTPGVFWSKRAIMARDSVYANSPQYDPKLGNFYTPQSKLSLIEYGGVGTIRLRPRRIDEVDCWLATAVSVKDCQAGIPLAIPDSLLYDAGLAWGDSADITGRVRFLQDADLEDIAQNVHNVRPLIVFVETLDPVSSKRPTDIVISPVVLFDKPESYEPQYTFVQCLAGRDTEIDEAAAWIQAYADKFEGRVVTNFDEQRPIFANAPLSYQKLVAKTYDRTIVNKYAGSVFIERLDTLTHQEINTQTFLGETHVGHNINVTGHAIVAIDSTLNNVTQTIGTAPGLNDKQKSELDELVKTLKAQLEPLRATHADEAKEIVDAVEKAVANVSKPAPERKLSMLQLSAKGLTEAANLVKDIAPTVIATAGLIAKFVVGV